ncbi:PAS domain-containing hybrid sensor histidine kinase/response regulator [Pseudoalteromonas luteoviolacea]|uniref:PAS domain-containing hybrid sensor histidine kinase/response regulator n=1 Tax=Pseudoalteromonas luteoviolacea TaxID=43657 RepID=UPI001B39110B|nr:PAS domain S-box protein [Pseudoalteromonas luteoviolacea]MBQ4834998.1 PAS domain S-box protein [Pseudoalteromonas luteoviolacea]
MSQNSSTDLESENKKLKLALEKVTSERDKYKNLFDASGDALSIIDLKSGKFIECNAAAVEMHGVQNKDKFLQLGPADISPKYQPCGQLSESLAKGFITKARDEGAQLFQWTHNRLDGSTFPCLVSLTAIQSHGEDLILAIGRDITEIVRTQKQLDEAHSDLKRYKKAYQREKEKFEHFVNLAPVGIAINYMKDGSFQYVNHEFSNMTGYSVEELNNMDYWQLTPRKYEEQEYKQLDDLKQQGRYGPYAKEYIHKAGSTFPVLLSGIKITDSDGEDFIWSVVQDTTQQKAIEAQIQKAKEAADSFAIRMQLANDSAEIGVWEWDLVSNELIWDDWMFKLYGVTKGQFSGVYEAWVNSVHPDDIGFASAKLEAAVKGEGVYEPEFRVVHPNGVVRTMKASAEVIKDEIGRAIKVIGVNYDVTDKVNVIEKLAAAKTEAENSAKAKSDFVANMSHEIRTPMNAILGGLQLLETAELSKDFRQILSNASFSAQSLLTIINDILDYSKIESNKLELEKAPLSFKEIIESVKYDLDSVISNKGIGFIVTIEDSFDDRWLGDLVRVKQILLNLTSNAVKFTDKGSVKITVRSGNYDEKEAVNLQITDTGIGMSEEAQKCIFDRFSQADTSTTRKYGGTGLGMSITASLVQLMKGKIELTSQQGKGTSIDLWLPLDKSSQESNLKQCRSLSPPNLAGKKILIAEDNKINQILIKTMLKDTYAELMLVENGVEAVEACQNDLYDLVLMDIHMPEMDGVEAQKIINKHCASMPVIALTANVMTGDVKKYLAQGFVAHIGKPVDLRNLYGVLKNYAD